MSEALTSERNSKTLGKRLYLTMLGRGRLVRVPYEHHLVRRSPDKDEPRRLSSRSYASRFQSLRSTIK